MSRSFPELLQPVAVDDFYADYWQNKPLHVERNQPDFYEGLYSLEDFDRSVEIARRDPDSKVVFIPPPDSDYEREVRSGSDISFDELYSAFDNGYTLHIEKVHRYWPELGNLVRSLSEDLQASHVHAMEDFKTTHLNINLYLTPPGHQGFPPHYDAHDVYLLQIHGAKDWSLFEQPVDRPTDDAFYRQATEGRGVGRFQKGEEELSVAENTVLNHGDLLYIPRGMPHKGECLETTSLHLTIGVVHLQWRDVLIRAINLKASQEPALRSYVPLEDLDGEKGESGVPKSVEQTLADLFEPDLLEEARASFQWDEVVNSDFPTDGYFAGLDQLDDLDAEDVVKRRPGLDVAVNGRTLQFAGQEVSVSENMKSALPYIQENPSFVIADLPTVTMNKSKLMLVKRLIRKGLLTVVSRED